MPYSRAFFELQLTFAHRLADKFDLPLTDTVRDYTTFTKSLGEEWKVYSRCLESPTNALEQAELAHHTYLTHYAGDPKPQDTYFDDHPFFGSFYYELWDNDRIICPHVINNRSRLLKDDQIPVRHRELTAMFRHIQSSVPNAEIVRGNSWMYNLQFYRRLFPPQYYTTLPERKEVEFTSLACWGQSFNRKWKVEEPLAQTLFERLKDLDDLDNLRHCFFFPILQPQCSIEYFYTFYNV